MAGTMRLGCKCLTLGARLRQALCVPHHTPCPLLTQCSLTAGGLHPGKCYGLYPCPGPKQPSANTGCQMLNKYGLVLASQAEAMVYSQRSPQVPTAGNLLHNTLLINLLPFPVSFPCFPTSAFWHASKSHLHWNLCCRDCIWGNPNTDTSFH